MAGMELTVSSPGAPPRSTSGRDQLRVGGDADCDVIVAGPGVKPEHLLLQRERGFWHLTDRSAGASFHEGQPVERVLVLGPMTLRLGDPASGTLLQIEPEVPSRPSQTAAPGVDGAAAPPPAPGGITPGRDGRADAPAGPPGAGTLAGATAATPAPSVTTVAPALLPYALLVLVVLVPLIVWAAGGRH